MKKTVLKTISFFALTLLFLNLCKRNMPFNQLWDKAFIFLILTAVTAAVVFFLSAQVINLSSANFR